MRGIERDGRDALGLLRMRDEDLDPGVGAALAEQVPGDVAGREAAEPREREHAVGVVLADAGAAGPRLGGRGRDRGDAPVVAEVVVDALVDEVGELEPGRTRRL